MVSALSVAENSIDKLVNQLVNRGFDLEDALLLVRDIAETRLAKLY